MAGARLSASVTSFPPGAIAPYPQGFDSGDGHLCRASSFSTCGAGRFITDIPTDANGQATYLYWAPGATSQHTVKLTVKAQKACRTCSKGRQTGENTHELKISPHVIYKSQATLGHEALDTLELWAKNDKNFESILRQPVNAFAEHELENAIKAIAMKLSLSEVSYCGVRENCGPGDSTPGIEPFLLFDFRAEVPSAQPTGERTIFTDQFVLPYDASFYDLLQFNGNGPP